MWFSALSYIYLGTQNLGLDDAIILSVTAGLSNERFKLISHNLDYIFCSDPTCGGGGTIYSNGFFLFREFWPTDIFIVEKCAWYH